MITLQFVCGSGISSQAIAWFSSGHLSHVDCVLPDGSLLGARSDKCGGRPPGVQVRPPNYEKWQRVVRAELDATPIQEKMYYDFLNKQIGKPYDKKAILAFVLNRDWRERDSWICSELQAAALESCGWLPPLYLSANKITPVALAFAVSARGARLLGQ